jgi:hypothetical protein
MQERIGTITVKAQTVRKSYEYAAWWASFECPEQTCELWMNRNPEGHPQFVWYTLKGTCVDAYLASHFGGVPFGKDTAGQRMIGTAGEVSIQIYAYQLSKVEGVFLDSAFAFLAGDSRSPEWLRAVADWRLTRYGTKSRRHLSRLINIEWFEQHASPEVVAQLTD